MRHPQRTGHVHKVLQYILPVLLQPSGRVRGHELAEVLLKVLHEVGMASSPKHERPGLALLRRVIHLLDMRPLLFLVR